MNRIRAQTLPFDLPSPPTPYYTATWSENGSVYLYDIATTLQSLLDPASIDATSLVKKPLHTITQHANEGFALAWSPPLSLQSTPRLLTGDLNSKIFLTSLTESSIVTSPNPFTSHTSSIEDLQFSPTESTVFTSASADGTIKIWDTRIKNRKNVLGIERVHEGSDVNVLNWNRISSFLLLSGGDNGGIKVWDLRNLRG